MQESGPLQEGFIPFRGHQIWYGIAGDKESPGKLPLLVLHGGPGAAHDYLESVADLASTGRRVIFYDQLGCGNSSTPANPDMWTVELYVEEIDVVRQALDLDRVHILGQSWGGMLAMQYVMNQPAGLAGLVVADSPASVPRWMHELGRLRAELPPEIEQTLLRHEAAGTTGNSEYEEAVMVFYGRHVCRLDPLPDYVERSFAKLAENPEVYHTMNGPSEFHVIGTLKNWDIIDGLRDIHVPTLIVSGRHDEVTPATVEIVHKGIPGSEWILFEDSSHMPHAEERERFMSVVGDFLHRCECAL